MKFMLFPLPTLPATLEERRRERPIAFRTERWQRMFDELVEIARLAEDLGFDVLGFPEHHLHTEGLEMGGPPPLLLHMALHTSSIRVGPIGYVLPGWDPLRLAITTSWLDQLTKGRTIVGFARGYQHRWLNPMAQHLHVSATRSDQSEMDRLNRKVFEEVYQVLKLAWADEPFRFQGEFFEYPTPFAEGTPWPAAPWTEEFGAPGEIEHGRIWRVAAVPKPYQKPHPPLFQAFSVSEQTIRWCAREGIVPMIVIPQPEALRDLADIYKGTAAEAGRNLHRGESIGVLRQIYFGTDAETRRLAEAGHIGVTWKRFWGHFGFWEAFHLEGDQEYPLPSREWTYDRLRKVRFLYTGSVDDVRRDMDELVETANPEWFMWMFDQGLLPMDVLREQLRTFGEKVLPHYR